MNIKTRLIDLIHESHKITHAFISGLSETERDAVGTAEKWSAKDNVAHMIEWVERFCNDLDTARRGETVIEVEHINQANLEIFEQHSQLSWQAIIEKVNRAHVAMLAQVEAMSEEQLQSTQFFAWQNRRPIWHSVAGSYCIHPIMHLSSVLIQHGHIAEATRMMEMISEKLLSLDESAHWRGTTLYNLACHYSQAGEKGKAIARLDEALRMYPEFIEWSKQDTDLNPLRDEPAYQQLMQSLESA